MSTGILSIDTDALAANWRALDAMSAAQTAAVIKADGYGLGSARVARVLANAGCRRFFVAVAEEAAKVRNAIGPDAEINVFSGHMAGDTEMIADLHLTPMLNAVDQIKRHIDALPGHPFGIQLDTGMNRLGLEMDDWADVAPPTLEMRPTLLMSHLACADEPDHPMNAHQLGVFHQMTDDLGVPRSLAATGGILLGPEYHFDLCRPGIGLYGGAPFAEAHCVAHLDLPVIQTRAVAEGETAGYGNTWRAQRPSTLATVSGGYADGLIRALSQQGSLWHGPMRCPMVGRVSMDTIIVDITDLPEIPRALTALGPQQTVDHLADAAGTIGYEILTSLGSRYTRRVIAQ